MMKRVEMASLDIQKYTSCVNNSVQKVYSAEYHFLTTVNKHWEFLIYKDYEAVMPVPIKFSFGFKTVVHPPLCQQLGVFSTLDSREVNQMFLSFLRKHYMVRYYAFNIDNKFSETLHIRKNYILQKNSYENVVKAYSESRRRQIKKHRKNDQIEIRRIAFSDCRYFIFKHIKSLKNDSEKFKYLETYKKLEDTGQLYFTGFYLEGSLINLIAILEKQETAVLLGAFNDSTFNQYNGSAVLIDEVLKRNIRTKNFDFEGSEVPNVEEFYRRFNAQITTYPYISNTLKSLVKNIFF